MTGSKLNRRQMLASGLGAGAFFLLPEVARAQHEMTSEGIALGPGKTFSFEAHVRISKKGQAKNKKPGGSRPTGSCGTRRLSLQV